MNKKGLLLCARYALPPNLFSYCGPEKQNDLKAYSKENITDKGLKEILTEFETLYPYLRFIAEENNLKDAFDPRVVEAYWLGNSLLHKISPRGFSKHFIDGLALNKKIKKKEFEILMGKITAGAIPFHTFHVLNIFTRTGHQAIKHTLETMDNCRISWGKISSKYQVVSSKYKNSKNENKIQVLTKPLVIINGKFALGKEIIKTINLPYEMAHGLRSMTYDQWLSFHWNYFCDFLSPRQMVYLEKYTNLSIKLANIII